MNFLATVVVALFVVQSVFAESGGKNGPNIK